MQYVPLDAERVGMYQRRLERADKGIDLLTPDDLNASVLDLMDNAHFLECRERFLASPTLRLEDYRQGVALQPDEVCVDQRPDSSTLISTEHATYHYRLPKKRKTRIALEAETGTAALASMAAAELGATHATILGRQTGDANYDLKHAFKDRLLNLVSDGNVKTFVSLHGMNNAYTTDLESDRNYDVAIGVGSQPSVETLKMALKISKVCQKYGLLAAINPKFVKLRNGANGLEVRQDNDGEPVPVVFAAAREITTRSAVEALSKEKSLDIATLQLEFSSNLRLKEAGVVRGWRPTYCGTYIGCRVLLEALG